MQVRSAASTSTARNGQARRYSALPPGQRPVAGFPRFGVHLHHPPPAVPADVELRIEGVGVEPLLVPLTELATLPRRELAADFHCVAGWSATDLRWEGVAFATFYSAVIEPALRPGTVVTHFAFRGLDGYRSILLIEDALADNVLLAEHLNGEPLDSDHGAPVRLVSPSQYGFMSTKHLCHIELCAGEPGGGYHPSRWNDLGLQLVKPHARARVLEEERHRYLPARAVRPIYRLLIPPFAFLSSRGSRPAGRR